MTEAQVEYMAQADDHEDLDGYKDEIVTARYLGQTAADKGSGQGSDVNDPAAFFLPGTFQERRLNIIYFLRGMNIGKFRQNETARIGRFGRENTSSFMRSSFRTNSFLLILAFSICATIRVSAQDPGDTAIAAGKIPAGPHDTLRTGRSRPGEVKNALNGRRRPGVTLFRGKIERRKFDSTLFTAVNEPTTGDYLESLEKVFQLLSDVPATTSSFTRLQEIDQQFDQEDSALGILKDRITNTDDRSLNIRNLEMYNTLLDALNKSTDRNAAYLATYDKKMDGIRDNIAGLKKDTLMLRIFRDSTLKDSFASQLLDIKVKWRQADSLIRLNVEEINDLKARASADNITITDLLYRVDLALKDMGKKAFGKEERYLWESHEEGVAGDESPKRSASRSINGEQKLAQYYFANSRDKRFWLILTGVVFFFWVWLNFRTLKRLNRLGSIEPFHFRYAREWPLAGSFLFVLSLAPLFDLYAPAIYIESIQLMLMLLLTFMLRKRLPRPLFYGWCIFILLFLLLPVTRLFGLSVETQRWVNFILNMLSIALGSLALFGQRIKGLNKLFGSSDPATTKKPRSTKLIFYSGVLYVFLNLLALFCNLFGRITLSRIFSTTAIYAFAQTVSLVVFVKLVVEAFLLQIQTSRVRKGYPEQFDTYGVTRSIYRFSTGVAILLWLIVFTSNLNLFDAVNDLLTSLFTDPRQVGSFSFTLGGILLFFAIIWTANFLQRYITFFFGDTGDDAAIDDKGQRSKLLVTRLILLTGGFLLAVAASGLPMDRITVILGALSVGIGLGLQSIVNNFVSGIILIFDRPLRIGDMVEIGDKKGKVKEIGIRSSTLLTDEGAEVIIPNGDVLSHNIVNWTLSNNHVRVALSFTIDKPSNPETINTEEIKNIVKANANVLESREPEIILNNLSSKTIEIKVFFWAKDFGKTSAASVDIRAAIYHHLDKQGIIIE
jgi:potassium-dependent mechanosensitive channel